MDGEKVRSYFEKLEVACDYARAVEQVGLWESEKIVFENYLKKDMRILELGCGAGRIAHGLFARGFEKITASDFSENMIEIAKAIAQTNDDKIEYLVQDARNLSFPDNTFDAAIFGFNGLMQIPKRENRKRAMCEIHRVLCSKSLFIFTTHDRQSPVNAQFWREERKRWQRGEQNPQLDEFGDKFYSDGSGGNIFIHSPDLDEVEKDLNACGFEIVLRKRRSQIAKEPVAVEEFSDDCVFWTAIKI